MSPILSQRGWFWLALVLGAGAMSGLIPSGAAGAGAFPPDQIEFFEKSVRPLLAERCYGCHGPEKHQNGLRLDGRELVLHGSDYGKVVEPGNPSASKLIQAVRHQPGMEPMPKKGETLKAEEIALLERWIQMGLPWPEEKVVAAAAKASWKEHWAYQPIRRPAIPAAGKAIGGGNPIDAFVGAKILAAGLDFAPAADAKTLCRRMFITATGLQPTFSELQDFEKAMQRDPRGAVAALAEKLLASPHYGERWARHWLDVARYADTDGYQVAGRDIRYPYAYTYRDWVVKSLNADMPYDRFLTLQLAADRLLPEGKVDDSLAALGFLTVGDRFISDRTLQIDDRIDVVGRGMLGVTVGCARCHDHKYDPIPSKDYYALYSVFNSSELPDQKDFPVISANESSPDYRAYQAEVAKIEEKELAFKKEVYNDLRQEDQLRDYLVFASANRDLETTAFRGKAGQAKLRDRVAFRWRDFLKQYAYAAKPHPVMLAWRKFADVPAPQLAERAAQIVQELAKPEAGCNPAVVEAFKQQAPKSMQEVASVYARVILGHLSGQPMPEAAHEQVRQLMLGGVSPMSVPVEQADIFFTRKDAERVVRINNERTKLDTTHPGAPPRAMVMTDKPKPADVRVFVRGNPARQGDPAPRAFLTMFGGQKFTDGSGRLELARAITSKDNPLTARVAVNRIWLDHFGRPLVSQPSDFGVQTPRPAQADLLDYLAATLMENGWSLKTIHRLILTSRTYAQSSRSTPEKDTKDADNELVCRFNRQRLDYEAMRDALLEAASELDTGRMGGRAVALEAPEADTRRSVYLLVNRYDQATVPAMFDFANPDSHSPQRFVTTVPQQALFLMNSPFMRERSMRLAALTPVKGSTVDSESLRDLYRRVLLRDPKPEEVELAQRFLQDADGLAASADAFRWSYGTAEIIKDPAGRVVVNHFEPFANFGRIGKTTPRWTPTAVFPDPKVGHLFWSPGSGHPGNKAPAVMQWRSPFEREIIRISGDLKRPSDRGNGIRGWIISSRTGAVVEKFVGPKSSAEMVAEIEVRKGDVLSFAVGEEGDTNSDSFSWTPKIERVNKANGQVELVTKADTDFCGPSRWPLNRPQPQTPLAQLAQVLMMSNEFMFFD